MIFLRELNVRGSSAIGAFEGSFSFTPGLQVVAANNHFGKSLAVTSVAWCLGLERMFGLQDNDSSRFPVAVRDVIELGGQIDVPVVSSEAEILLQRSDGARLRLTRAIKGDASRVTVSEEAADSSIQQRAVLFARKNTMKDETGGLQRFLFEWCSLPRTKVVDTRGEASELYLENLAPLFFIDQNEGWTDLQALQVHRYGLLEISDIAVEYLLGATEAIDARFQKQTLAATESRHKANAATISARVNAFFAQQGFVVDWTDHGSVTSIQKRWSAQTLGSILKSKFHRDLAAEVTRLTESAGRTQNQLTSEPLDPQNTAAASDASQVVVELKERRHSRREELRVIRRQRDEQTELLGSIEHRLHSARDILRLKVEGIGRIEIVECPTCHRSLDPATFALTAQSTESVQAHIDALARDKRLVAANIESATEQMLRVDADLADAETRLREAERSLLAVNKAVGASREQVTKAATDLIAIETELDRVSKLQSDLIALQSSVDRWLSEAAQIEVRTVQEADLKNRITQFTSTLRALLEALGHGAILAQPTSELRLDEHYVPYLGPRRLRSLGSASDHSRLVAAFVLALAATSDAVHGLHPGFVVLDEPLQQNPDDKHRGLFIDFLLSPTARKLEAQTIIFTWLHEPELNRLRAGGVRIVDPRGEHFLALVASVPSDVDVEVTDEPTE